MRFPQINAVVAEGRFPGCCVSARLALCFLCLRSSFASLGTAARVSARAGIADPSAEGLLTCSGDEKLKAISPPGQTAQISTVILDNASEASAWGAFLSRFPKKTRLVQSPGLIRPLPSPLTQASASLPNEAETPFRCQEGFPPICSPIPQAWRRVKVWWQHREGKGTAAAAQPSPLATRDPTQRGTCLWLARAGQQSP